MAAASLTPSNLPDLAALRMDLPVLAFTVAISLASGILFGLAPALQLSKPDLNTVLRDEGRGSTGSRSRNRARSLMVIAQVALSMVLLVGSGLLIRSFVRLQTVNLGFDPARVLTMRIALPPNTAFLRLVSIATKISTRLRTIDRPRPSPAVWRLVPASLDFR